MGAPADTEQALREEVVSFCRLLHQKNYLAAYDGNVSVRLGSGRPKDARVLVTPTAVHKGFLSADDLVVVDMAGRQLSGSRPPSGELPMHLMALRARPDVRAVIHAHPPSAIALSLHPGVSFNVLPEVLLSVGEVPRVPYARAQTDELARAIEPHLQAHDAVVLERHGTLTVGRDLLEAYARTERVEHAAYILWMAHALGRPAPLPEAEVSALLELHANARRR